MGAVAEYTHSPQGKKSVNIELFSEWTDARGGEFIVTKIDKTPNAIYIWVSGEDKDPVYGVGAFISSYKRKED